jgi:hypothetical protein
MSAALRTPELPPEAVALIKEGTPKPQVEKPVLAAPAVREGEVSGADSAESGNEPELAKQPRARAATQREPEPQPAAGGLAHVSVRLPAEIPQALLRASLDRKLKRVKPWTQQDIVAEALVGWLKKNNFWN